MLPKKNIKQAAPFGRPPCDILWVAEDPTPNINVLWITQG